MYSGLEGQKRFQNDNGGQLKKDNEKNCVKSKIKTMRCYPYSSKSQENFERLHGVFSLKIYYDPMNTKNIRENWFNVDKREELG